MGPTRRSLFARKPPRLPERLVELYRILDDYEAETRRLLSRLSSTGRRPGTPTDDSPADHPSRIVFVCTGNRFRSPIAQAAAARLTAGLPIVVTSCGLRAEAGRPPLPAANDAAQRLGLDISHHRARRLTNLADSDLVVGFEFIGVAGAVIDGGASPDRTFMLTEAVELLASTGMSTDLAQPVTVPELVTRLDSARRESVDGSPHRSLLDPAAATLRVQRASASEIVRLTENLLAPLVSGAAREPARVP
jgi:protein-tyrosine-phosphatase